VHAFMSSPATCWSDCWVGERSARVALPGAPRTLLAELARIRHCRMVDRTGPSGRPRVRERLEELEPGSVQSGPSRQGRFHPGTEPVRIYGQLRLTATIGRTCQSRLITFDELS